MTTTSAAINSDSLPDAAFTIASDVRILLLYAHDDGSGVHYSFSDPDHTGTLTIDGAPVSGPNYPRPLFHDFTHSGHTNVCYPIEDDEVIRVYTEPLFDIAPALPAALALNIPNDIHAYFPDQGTTAMGLKVTAGLDSSQWSQYHLELKVYRKDFTSGIESTPIVDTLTPLNQLPLDGEGDWEVASTIDQYLTHAYFQYMRIVKLDMSGAVIQAGPASFGAVSVDDTPEGDSFQDVLKLPQFLFNGWSGFRELHGNASPLNGFARQRRTFGVMNP